MSEMVKPAQDQYPQQVSNTDKTWQLQTFWTRRSKLATAATLKGYCESYFKNIYYSLPSKIRFYNTISGFVPFECSNCDVCIVWGWDRRQRRNFSVPSGWHEGSNPVYGLLKASYGSLCYTIQVDYSFASLSLLSGRILWTGVVCSYMSQTLVVAASAGCLQGSICMCITLVQPLLWALHMNRARCTLEVYNFLREGPVTGHLFVMASETKGRAPGTKRTHR